MNPKLRLAAQLLAVAVVAALSCWLTGRLVREDHGERGIVDGHYSIHEDLGLTEEQEKSLEPVERAYEARWKELAAQIATANIELADALQRDEQWTPAVAAAVEKITRAQGELQQATLEHVFAMKPFLTPEQYDPAHPALRGGAETRAGFTRRALKAVRSRAHSSAPVRRGRASRRASSGHDRRAFPRP